MGNDWETKNEIQYVFCLSRYDALWYTNALAFIDLQPKKMIRFSSPVLEPILVQPVVRGYLSACAKPQDLSISFSS